MKLTIHYQGEATPTIYNLERGWNFLRYSLGAWLFNSDEALLVNGVVDGDEEIGAVFVKTISAEGNAGRIFLCDDGNHVIHPRALLPIRTHGYLHYREVEPRVTAHLPRERMDWKTQYRAIGDVMLQAYGSGEASPSVNIYGHRMGPWMPLDEHNPGAPGGYGLEPLPGWERAPLYRILGCDLALHRMAVALVDKNGELHTPILAPGEYNLARGWEKTTQLPMWCASGTSGDVRYPRIANNGECAYFHVITGTDRWGGFLPYDGQHLIRGIRHAQAAAQVYRDPIASKALELIAHDALLAWGHIRTVAASGMRGQGASWAGRELGWVLHAAHLVGREDAVIITRALACVEMTNGLHQRCAFGPPWGFAPDPWAEYGMPTTIDAAQSIEAGILAWSLGATDSGQAVRILRTLVQDERPPKAWLGVAPAGLPAFNSHAVKGYGGPETFNVWYAMGRALEYAPQNREFIQMALRLPPPGAAQPKNSIRGLYETLVKNPYVTHTALVIRELERHIA